VQLEEYYRERGLLAEIEGERSVTDVTEQIHAAIRARVGQD
jgi:adenylate kinase family enzyme